MKTAFLRQIKVTPHGSSQTKKSSARNWRKNVTPWLFLGPSLICVAIFVLLPFLDVVRRSFFSAISNEFVGFKNYLTLFDNQAFKLASKNTIIFTLACIPALILVSLILALTLNACKERSGIFKTSFLIPMAIPVASIVLLWRVLFHENGIINSIVVKLGAEPIDWINSSYAIFLLIFSYLWKNAGYDMVLWLSGISAIPLSLYEAAQVDGASPVQRLLRVTMPNLLPTLFTISVISLLNSFKVFREAYLISGDRPHKSIYMLQHLFNNWFTSLDIDKMCAGAVLLALCVFIIIMALQLLLGKKVDE